MGTGTLNNRSAGQTILDTFFNDIHGAINGDFVGRNTSGVPTSGQNLGTTALPWGTVRCTGLTINGDAVDTSQLTAPANRVISGKTRTTSDQPAFITPSASLAFTLAASTTNLSLDINGSTVTVSTDILVTGLTAAPSSNNTCLSNDALALDSELSRTFGEYENRSELVVDNMGSEIVALVGKFAAFKINDGSNDEYFMAFVESSVKLSRINRGYFYNSSLAQINRIKFTENDTITLMKAAWVFVENNGTTVNVTYNPPTYSHASPSSPATGDYWYDLDNQTWKRYDGATFQIINRTLVGVVASNATATVVARCEPFYANHTGLCDFQIDVATTEIIRARHQFAQVEVMGRKINFGQYLPTWNITTDLATSADMYNATEQASTFYYLYISNEGDTIISDISPYYFPNRKGWYHPHNPWRAVGLAYNNSGSNLITAESLHDYGNETRLFIGAGSGSTNTKVKRFASVYVQTLATVDLQQSASLGDSYTVQHPGVYAFEAHHRHDASGHDAALILNGNQPTVDPGAGFTDTFSVLGVHAVSSNGSSIMWTGRLKRGDKVWFQTSVINDTANQYVSFSCKRVS
jgi:hypothetical protein